MTDPDRDQFAASQLVQVTLVWDATLGSPTELQPWGGKVVAVPPDFLPLPPQGTLFGLKGFSRSEGNGTWSWILQGDVDPVDNFLDSLTGRGGWTVPASRTTVKIMAQRLFSAGIPRSTIVSQFPAFYNAVAAEIRAEASASAEPKEG